MFFCRRVLRVFVPMAVLSATLLVSRAVADEALDKAFEALSTYEWGSDRSALLVIDNAVAASHGDAAVAKSIESRLVERLTSKPSPAAQDYICRQLSLVGTAASVPALADLLPDEKLSHMARYALERIPDDAATAALRAALPKVDGNLKVGVIHSLGVRRDAASTESLSALLNDKNETIVAAAAAALGNIGTSEAARTLGDFQTKASESLKLAAADAYLVCAERLLADGKKLEAMAIYRSLAGSDQPQHIRLAATRGMLAVAQQK